MTLHLDDAAHAAARRQLAKPTPRYEPGFESNVWISELYKMMEAKGARIPNIEIDRTVVHSGR